MVGCGAGRKTVAVRSGCMHCHKRTSSKTGELIKLSQHMTMNMQHTTVTGISALRVRSEQRAQPPHSKVLGHVKLRASYGGVRRTVAALSLRENEVQCGLTWIMSELGPKNRGQGTHSSLSLNT